MDSRNPGRGVTNFDTFSWAFVNVVVVSTLSNWVDMMFPLWDATSWLVYLYMLSIILLGSFFAVNVFIVRGHMHAACGWRWWWWWEGIFFCLYIGLIP